LSMARRSEPRRELRHPRRISSPLRLKGQVTKEPLGLSWGI
jgi:hypothetical protein